MALDDDVIRYSDIIQPDGSIDKLISTLESLNNSLSAVGATIASNADKIASSVDKASGATRKGKEAITEAAEAASRLERAYRDLAIAESEEGKMIAQLKALTADANKASVAELRAIEAKVGSYDKLQQELKEYVTLYKSLTKEEREDVAMGKEVIDKILEYKNQLKALNAELKPHIEQLSRVKKAEQELAFLRSEEGQKLLALQKQIRAVKAEYAGEKAAIDPLVAAKQKLEYAQSEGYKTLQSLNFETQKEQKIAKLTAIIKASEKDSYARLSAEYALGKLRLSEYSIAELQTSERGQALVKHLEEVYAKMQLIQESTGYYGLGVGKYSRAFDGLSYSVAQVVRELPAAAVSLNTFFLAISNNIPMVVDEITKLRKAGTAGINIVKGLGKAVFGWQTLLVIGLTAFSMYGDEIIAWAGKLFKAKDAALSFTKVQKTLAKELASTNASYGDSVVSLTKLAAEWRALSTNDAMQRWIKDNKSEFDKLGVSITSINDAELAFVVNTEHILEALDLRAQAAAATKVATEKYEQAFIKQKELEADVAAFRERGWGFGTGSKFNKQREEIANLKKEAKGYTDLASAANLAARAKIKAAGLSTEDPLKGKGRAGSGSGSGEEGKGRMVADLLNSEDLKAQKNLNKALTDQELEELRKRRAAAKATYEEKVQAAQNSNEKLKRILADEEDDYRDLTEEQRKQAEATIATNERAIKEYGNVYRKTLDDIAKDEQIFIIQNGIKATELRLKTIKEGSDEEFALRKDLLRQQLSLSLAQNAKLPKSQQQDPLAMVSAYGRDLRLMGGSRAIEIFDQQQELEKARFEAVEHSELEITKFQLAQERDRWLLLIDLARQGALEWSDAQLEAAAATVSGIINRYSKLSREGSFAQLVSDKGLFGAAFTKVASTKNKYGTPFMSEDEIQKAISGFSTYADVMISNIKAILDAEIEYAERMKSLADERVADAQRAYDAEVEGRNKGYANNVATAKKELEQEKRNQQQKQRLLEEAQRRQEALNAITQTSSLITASAQLWQSFSGIPIVGPALAIASIATMWGSFAAAKIKARQITARSEEYGEGGLEFLEGGSHASGNDIDLGVNNSRNRRMRAEGGEALAIINKRNTRRYRGILPDVIDSFNKGTFEDKYLNAFGGLSNNYFLGVKSNADLSRLEAEVAKIRKQGETQYFLGPDGVIIELKGNVKRIIKS